MSHRPSEKEYRQSEEAGESARRAGRGVETCPRYGMGEYGRIRAEAWRNGWERENKGNGRARR